MSSTEHTYTYGIEEEFFLAGTVSRNAVTQVPKAFVRDCRAQLGDCVQHEMLQSQVEIATPILSSPAHARDMLGELRRNVGRVAAAHDLQLLAAGTHPLGAWRDHVQTDKPRYDSLMDDFQIVGRRNLLCALHVHVAVPPGVDRVALMNRLMPWLPVLLALSTSSPFWNRQRTGLVGYRQAAYDEWPRTGIPDYFADESEYAAFVNLLTRCGAIRDGSFLWWAIRPSSRYPTLELRIADSCTHLDDALAIAAAFRCLVAAYVQRPELGAVRTSLTRRVIDENRWRAKRYGVEATLIDEAAAQAVPFDAMLARLVDTIAPEAAAFACEPEIAHLAQIVRRGSSAHEQLAVYRARRDAGDSRLLALQHVVDWLIATTLAR